jgi:hypothetical protein
VLAGAPTNLIKTELPGQGSEGRLCSGSWCLRSVSAGGAELDVQGGDAEGLDLLSNIL